MPHRISGERIEDDLLSHQRSPSYFRFARAGATRIVVSIDFSSHLDEVYLKINGRMVYLWRAVDGEGEVLDVLIQSRRNKRAALKLMRKLLKKYAFVPDRLVTDDLRSYAAAATILGLRGAMTAVDGATTGRRIRISRRGDENAGCRGSRAPDRRKDFSQPTPPSRIPSTSSATSPQRERTGHSGPRRCRRGAKPLLRPDALRARKLLRTQFGNVTTPARGPRRLIGFYIRFNGAGEGCGRRKGAGIYQGTRLRSG